MSLSNAILRGVTGAFVLNSGLSKRNLPTEAAQGLQGFAATGVPQVTKLEPDTFGKFVAYSEIGIGAAPARRGAGHLLRRPAGDVLPQPLDDRVRRHPPLPGGHEPGQGRVHGRHCRSPGHEQVTRPGA